MAIPTILKGDSAAAIPFTAPEAVAVLLAVYQDVTRRFEDVPAGASLSIEYTADETARFQLGTFPLVFAVKYADGRAKTYPLTAKIKVTDSPALVYGTAVDVDPGGGKPLDGVDPLPERHTMDDVAEKVNEVIRKLSSGAAATALALCLSAFGATIQTAPLGQLYNDARVVTNVIFDAAPDFSTNNAALVATIEAKAPASGNYAAVSNAAMSAAGQIAAATNALTAAIDGKRDKMDLVYRNTTHNGIEKWAVQIQGESVTLLVEWDEEQERWFNQDPPVYGLGISISASGYILSTTGGEFPFTLSGGSATVSDGWFTFTLTPVMYPDDRLALVSEIGGSGGPTNVEEQIAAATNAVAAAAKNYTDEQIAKISGGGEWNRPGEWTLAFDAIPTTPTIQEVSFTTNVETGVIISNATAQVSESLSAHVFPIVLDELSQSSPPTVTLSCDDATTTIDGSVFTATEDGVYTVRGVASNGVARSAQVAIYSSHTTRRTTRAYVADANGLRQDLNEYTREVLTSASDNGTLDYIEDVGPGSFRSWGTITPAWAWPGRGRDSPWAIAPKVLVSASHWGWYWPTGEVTLPDIVGGTNFTIKISSREYWPNLVEWARANGYTAAETAIADMVDIRLGVIEEGYIPDACLPYLVDTEELDALFGGSLEGITAWFYPQGDSITREGNHYPYCIPVALLPSDYNTERIRWTGAALLTDSYATTVRADVLSAIGTYDARNWYRIRPGDSGRPCFIRWEIFDIVISQAHTVGTGPSFPAAAKIIRAFCAAHGCAPKTLPR